MEARLGAAPTYSPGSAPRAQARRRGWIRRLRRTPLSSPPLDHRHPARLPALYRGKKEKAVRRLAAPGFPSGSALPLRGHRLTPDCGRAGLRGAQEPLTSRRLLTARPQPPLLSPPRRPPAPAVASRPCAPRRWRMRSSGVRLAALSAGLAEGERAGRRRDWAGE